MPIRVSPITTRKRSSSRNRTYKNMHNRAFPPKSLELNAYINKHNIAFPSSKGLSFKSYKKMHKIAFPTKRSGSRS